MTSPSLSLSLCSIPCHTIFPFLCLYNFESDIHDKGVQSNNLVGFGIQFSLLMHIYLFVHFLSYNRFLGLMKDFLKFHEEPTVSLKSLAASDVVILSSIAS